jgi:hypothetical protein
MSDDERYRGLSLIECKLMKARLTRTACKRNQELARSHELGAYVSTFYTGLAHGRWVGCKDCPKYKRNVKVGKLDGSMSNTSTICKHCGRKFKKGRNGYCNICWSNKMKVPRPRK